MFLMTKYSFIIALLNKFKPEFNKLMEMRNSLNEEAKGK